MDYHSYTKGVNIKKVLHSAIEATKTSDAIPCSGAKAIMITLTEAGTVNNRSGVLTITISNDGENFYAYNMLIDNVANSNSQQLTRLASKTRAATGTDILFLDPKTLGAITHFKSKVTITDGGAPVGTFTVKSTVCN